MDPSNKHCLSEAENYPESMTSYPQGLSVVVCCYNSANRIGGTLQHLLRQKLSEQIDFEIIVVDNNCTDNTVAKVAEFCSKFDGQRKITVVTESRPGLAYARERGFAASKFETIVLVDDDNHLADNYLQLAFDTMAQNPQAGIVGGIGEAVYEAEIPKWLENNGHVHATGRPWGVTADEFTEVFAVYGAGMVIRKKVLDDLKSHRFEGILSDRKGKELSSGGDTELCLAARLLNWKVFYHPQLKFKHLIPPQRTTWPYLKLLFRGFGKAKPYIDLYAHVLAGNPAPPNTRFGPAIDRMAHLLREFRENPKLSLFAALSGRGNKDMVLASQAQLAAALQLWAARDQYRSAISRIYAFAERARQNKP